ncbi:Lactate dehydrogenase [Micromonospora rhizosphaerae]|uniref:Lactate dehydrogenase n=1 Tax=Micromonospora rhizosphaerae TaxID=568872 RepID=A0A1C6SAW7_9ACTN|nr:NAD(P)-dependent oxidoreductase [Micromonospora rhizosphaerae]SCL26481.1 Lactate dehydrogenase [Micromonospora rhizosphaerae]
MGSGSSVDRPRLLVLDDREGLVAAAPGTAALRELCEVSILDRPLAEVPDADLRDVRFLLAIRERTRLDAATLARFPALELLLQTGGHAYHVDRDELRRRGIVTALGRRAQVVRAAMPELTFMLAIACLRRLGEASRQMSAGEWAPLTGRLLAGRRLGILGLGRHGRNVARLGRAFGMDVVAWDRAGEDRGTGTARTGVDGVPLLPLEDLLRSTDVLTVHLRLSDQSRGLLDRARLQSMKPRSVLVNTARGAIVDEDALVEALRDGPLAAAGLDVFTEEPLPASSPLRSLPNAVLTPHLGWTVEEVFTEFAAIAADQVRDYLGGVLWRDELLDPDIQPAPGRAGGLAEAGSS